jgi:hypothetical protein
MVLGNATTEWLQNDDRMIEGEGGLFLCISFFAGGAKNEIQREAQAPL